MGPEFARCRGIVFVVVALGFLAMGIALTCTTISYTKTYPGIYVAYIGELLTSSRWHCSAHLLSLPHVLVKFIQGEMGIGRVRAERG